MGRGARRLKAKVEVRSVLFIAVPVSLLEMIAALMFAPLRRNVVFPAPLGYVLAFNPNVFVMFVVVPVVARRDDRARSQLLMDRGRWRDVDINADAGCINHKRNRKGPCKSYCQERCPDDHMDFYHLTTDIHAAIHRSNRLRGIR